MKIKNKRKLSSLASILMILITTTIVGVYAYYQMDADVTNEFIIGENKGKIVEDFPENPKFNGPVTKVVRFQNTGDYDQIIRVRYSETWTDKTGNIISNKVNNDSVVTKNWTTIWPEAAGGNQDDLWVYGGDGWFYYKSVLPAHSGNDSITAPVLERLELNTALSSEELKKYSEGNYSLSFQLEHVQATEAAVKKVFGKDCTIGSDGMVHWN
ncbi:BsaA family SipW-dependent biofilm matrix protein [Alloiococcus sp. CFN-8]|uniref:BsaA family SipW-dependent biofilm matrix protein n=1 Tax=Alloiococcus sp. CFN-8 TaxID=3416081 RepID=UPI003CEAE309